MTVFVLMGICSTVREVAVSRICRGCCRSHRMLHQAARIRKTVWDNPENMAPELHLTSQEHEVLMCCCYEVKRGGGEGGTYALKAGCNKRGRVIPPESNKERDDIPQGSQKEVCALLLHQLSQRQFQLLPATQQVSASLEASMKVL